MARGKIQTNIFGITEIFIWAFELSQYLFELELLMPIKYLVAPNILKLGEGLWFKSDNAHKSLQNFIKCFSI